LDPVTYSIVVPAYNESARIGATLERALSYSAEHGWNAEIVVVDDGSTDTTPEIVRGLARKYPALRLLQNPGNRGKGYSVRNGMLHAHGEILLFSDADFSSPIEEAGKLFAALAEGADIAIGSRWLKTELQTRKQPLHRQLFGRMFNLALRLQNIDRWGFDPELLYLARKFGFKVVEVPVAWAHRDGTRLNPLRDGISMLGEMLRIRWNWWNGKYATATTHGLRPS
jgi:dolichyl-phosphate beta-glucosyltransferase